MAKSKNQKSDTPTQSNSTQNSTQDNSQATDCKDNKSSRSKSAK